MPRPAAATDSPNRTSSAGSCFVADTSAPTHDTLYVIGADSPGNDSTPASCNRYKAAPVPVVIAESPDWGADLRDVLDRGLPAVHLPRPDVVVTRDPNLLAYAASSADYFTVALPYDRTYYLVAVDSASPAPSRVERDALARDAVSADTRGATEPFASIIDATCLVPFAPPPAPAKPVVAYPADDPIARQLATRIVALAGARARPGWLPERLVSGAAVPRVAPIAADSIAGALATGSAAAVIALPRDPRARCGTPIAPLPWRGVPLIDSRAHAIVRRGSGAAFIVGADGTLRFIRRAPK